MHLTFRTLPQYKYTDYPIILVRMGGCQFGSLAGPLPFLFADVAGVISMNANKQPRYPGLDVCHILPCTRPHKRRALDMWHKGNASTVQASCILL